MSKNIFCSTACAAVPVIVGCILWTNNSNIAGYRYLFCLYTAISTQKMHWYTIDPFHCKINH